MDIGAFRKSKGKGKGKGKQGQQGQEKNKYSIECWNCGELEHHANDCWGKKNTNKGGSKEKSTKPRSQDMLTILTLRKQHMSNQKLKSVVDAA